MGMKIEIDAQDLFALKTEVQDQKETIKRLEAELYALNPNVLKDKIERQIKSEAWKLFESHIDAVFKKLGFKDSNRGVIEVDCGFWNHNREKYINGEEVVASLGARIESEFRAAYLRLGIKTDE
jgi:hypothetical protein